MTLNLQEIKAATKPWHPKLKALRRQLHKYPESSPSLAHTHEIIQDKLKSCRLKQIPLKHSQSLCFELQGSHPGPTLLFCANMCGTALMDHTNDVYHSMIPGFTHSEMNHDAEMASLIALMWCAHKIKKNLHGNIRILFMADDIDSTSSLKNYSKMYLMTLSMLRILNFVTGITMNVSIMPTTIANQESINSALLTVITHILGKSKPIKPYSWHPNWSHNYQSSLSNP